MQGSSGCTLYHGLSLRGSSVCGSMRHVLVQLSSRSDTVGKSRTPSSINVTAAMFAHLCNFQITSSLGYTAERICLKSVGRVKLNLLLLRKISYFIFYSQI